MPDYIVQVDSRAIDDINKTFDYYEQIRAGLGDQFADHAEKALRMLESISHFQIRYKHVRCLPIDAFPFMIHYTVDEQQRLIRVHAVIHTSLDPDRNWL